MAKDEFEKLEKDNREIEMARDVHTIKVYVEWAFWLSIIGAILVGLFG